MSASPVLRVSNLTYRYGEFTALRGISLAVQPGEIYGLLGPNGSGKSTLFQLIATMQLPSDGGVAVSGFDGRQSPDAVRSQLGVIFQHPSIDPLLTVFENLKYHGFCYGVRGDELNKRIGQLLNRLGLTDRKNDRAGTLSGGLKRRVEIAKGLIARPKILLMDEPSTGLDPVARRDLWELIRQLNRNDGIAVLVTTHIMEEAGQCSRVGILDQGELVIEGAPEKLTSAIGGDMVEIQTNDVESVSQALRAQFQIEAQTVQDSLRFEHEDGHHFIPKLVEQLPGVIDAITVRKPTLEDVFVHHTGHAFSRNEVDAEEHQEAQL